MIGDLEVYQILPFYNIVRYIIGLVNQYIRWIMFCQIWNQKY